MYAIRSYYDIVQGIEHLVAGTLGFAHAVADQGYQSKVSLDLHLAQGVQFREYGLVITSYSIHYTKLYESDELEGIITGRDVRFVTDLGMRVHEVMTPKARLVTVRENASRNNFV